MSWLNPRFPRKRVVLDFAKALEEGAVDLCEQHHKKDCDMKFIVNRYLKDGVLRHVSRMQGHYGDYVSAPDFYNAMIQVTEAQAMFDTVPASIREKFGNDVGKFLEFVQDPKNIDEMKKLKLRTDHFIVTAPVAPPAPSAPPAPPAPPAG